MKLSSLLHITAIVISLAYSHKALPLSRDMQVDSTFFAVDSYELSPSMKERLDVLCTKLNFDTDSVTHIIVAGSSSPDGEEEYNRELSLKRAHAVASYIMRHPNINDIDVEYKGLGENWPYFKSLVEEDKNLPCRDKILALIGLECSFDIKEMRLRVIGGGRHLELSK